MPLPIGDLEINVDGYEGTLSITNVDAQNKVTGILKLSSTHNVTGTWDEVNKKLSFSYKSYKVGMFWLTVSYVGYFFEAGSPLFKYNPPNGGIPPQLDWYVLTGSWTGLFFTSGGGWMARLAIP
jgi:hypothetical protein